MSLVLRVGTYNIRHGLGLDGEVDLARIAAVIEDLDVDVIGLQEVDSGWKRSGRLNQAPWLGNRLGMYQVFGPAFVRGAAAFGNAVLSRFPILSWQNHVMPSNRENRALLLTVLDCGKQRLNLLNTHLGLNHRERMEHIVKKILPELTRYPLVLCGDFNCRPESPELAELLKYLVNPAAGVQYLTYPSAVPGEQIDYILHSPDMQTVNIMVYPSPASDHCPLVAELVKPDL